MPAGRSGVTEFSDPVAVWVRKSCDAQHFPVYVADRRVLRDVVAIIGRHISSRTPLPRCEEFSGRDQFPFAERATPQRVSGAWTNEGAADGPGSPEP